MRLLLLFLPAFPSRGRPRSRSSRAASSAAIVSTIPVSFSTTISTRTAATMVIAISTFRIRWLSFPTFKPTTGALKVAFAHRVALISLGLEAVVLNQWYTAKSKERDRNPTQAIEYHLASRRMNLCTTTDQWEMICPSPSLLLLG